MIRSPRVTREKVFSAADALKAEGKDPSARLVRERIGSGSFDTIQRFLVEWRRSISIFDPDTTASEEVHIPQTIKRKMMDLLSEIWSAAGEQYKEEIARLEQSYREELQKAQMQHHSDRRADHQRIVELERQLKEKPA